MTRPGRRGGGRGRSVQTRGTRQAYPDPAKFASLVKAFFGLIQCLHHGHTLDGQRQGRHSAKAFQAKIKELNSFIRPARSGPWVQAEISKINESWGAQMSNILSQHYVRTLAELQDTAKTLCVGLDWPKAQQIAETWAQRNFRKKLNKDTLKSFRDMVKELTKSDNQVGSIPVPGTLVQAVVHPSSPTNSSSTAAPAVISTPPSSNSRTRATLWASTLRNPSTPLSVPLTNRFSPLASTSSEPAPSSSSASPGHWVAAVKRTPPIGGSLSKRNTGSQPKTTLSKSHSGTSLSPPTGTSPSVSQTKTTNKVWIAESTHFKNRDWYLPAVPDTIETLIVGDSNIGRITKSVDSTTSLLAYPGAKFTHFVKMFQKAKQQRGVCEHVKNVVLSCGINERHNKFDDCIFPNYKRACKDLRNLFPQAAVYFVLPNWSTNLDTKAQKNMHGFSKLVKAKDIAGLVHLIPILPLAEFVTDVRDQIHWTPNTANRLLEKWLAFINKPSKN